MPRSKNSRADGIHFSYIIFTQHEESVFKGIAKQHKPTKIQNHTSCFVILSIEKLRLLLSRNRCEGSRAARIGSGCTIGAGPVNRKETIINPICSVQFPRPGPSVLPNLAVGISRDADRPAMSVLFSSLGMTSKGLISKNRLFYERKGHRFPATEEDLSVPGYIPLLSFLSRRSCVYAITGKSRLPEKT